MKVLLALALLLSVTVAFGQTRVRGMITALEGDVLSVRARDGQSLKLKLPAEVSVSTARPATLAELKEVYVGATAVQKDGRLVALEVHTLPRQAKPGHRPSDLRPGSTMTNATLEGIARVSGGNEITLSYPGGTQSILVPDGTPVVRFQPGNLTDLRPGEHVFAVATRGSGDGMLVAPRLSVSKDGVRPSH